jgi:hypothetical protein
MGTTVKELMTRFVTSGLRQVDSPSPVARRRSRLPVIPRRRGVIPSVTAEVHARLDEREDRAKLRRSFGR